MSIHSEHKTRDSRVIKATAADEGDEVEQEDNDEEEYDESSKTTDFIRTKKILRDVFPTFLFSVIQLIQETIVLQFVGHYCGSTEFAAVGNYSSRSKSI